MFVPTHKSEHGHRDLQITMTSQSGSFVWYLFADGECHGTFQSDLNTWGYKPITLECPHCNATINQQERVECECGWIAEAMGKDSFFHIWQDSSHHHSSTTYIENGSIKVEKHRFWNLIVYVINSIHWLEIKAGK